ncbi:MAG: 4-hydroxythreonine-4-phosphate dehydrogenase PdxA [Rikenellaceae bacterium]
MSRKLKIGITQGDTNGVGWEIILKAFSDAKMFDICTPIIYGSAKVGEYYKSLSEDFSTIPFNVIESQEQMRKVKLNIVECGAVEQITPGEPSEQAGMAAIAALVRATEDLKDGLIDGIVTAPFNKKTVQSGEFAHPGHTEYMESQLEGRSMMMMCSELLRVGLVTKHIPIDQVAEAITKEGIVEDLKHLRKTLIADFGVVEPRIAVLALNPHAGDDSLLGDNEERIIKPAIVEAYGEGILAFGPFAADGFFAAKGYTKYDAVLAMYHDQGLIPFKTLSPEGVNFTAGLSKVRTSPDHGVAYDIAGKGVADVDSMRNAIYMAIDIIRSREIYAEISANPLKHIAIEEERGERGDRGDRPRSPRREFPRRGEAPQHREGGERREKREE